MKNNKVILICVIYIIALSVPAVAITADEIIEESEDVFIQGNSKIEMTMEIVNPDFERTVKMTSWSEGKDKSFTLVNSPAKEKGNTYLKLDNNIWSYIKKIDEEMKIQPTMMFQGMMGSEFTFDDMVRESSYTDDYSAKITEETDEYWELKLTPKKGSGITYKYLKYRVSKAGYIPIQVRYYGKDIVKDGKKIASLVRYMDYSEVKTIGGREIPTVWKVTNHKKKGRVTTVYVTSAEFDIDISESTFTKANLRRAR
ncbi:MAG: outer membrane lipoprotein-sorting protein [bacterium]|nr:outer membrane lipoprotein-sorting protein [bacterium]